MAFLSTRVLERSHCAISNLILSSLKTPQSHSSIMAEAPRGEANDYYQSAPEQPQQEQQPRYAQAPPQYGNNYGNNNYVSPSYEPQGEKQDFNQAFKLDKPKWNDWWAGLLVR
jgi:hypothetical protein